MGSVRDPGTGAMAASELAKAQLSAAQVKRQRTARRARESALKGSPAARKALAADYAAVNDREAYRGRPGATP